MVFKIILPGTEMNSANLNTLSDNAIKALIGEIDLNPIIKRMVKIYKWPQKSALIAADQYRNFLFLKKKYRYKHTIPPSLEIDEFWHNHVLNTKKYTEDCKKIFGEYLHHTPHHGENEEITQNDLEILFENETQRLYFKEFGHYIYQIKRKNLAMKIICIFSVFFNKAKLKNIDVTLI